MISYTKFLMIFAFLCIVLAYQGEAKPIVAANTQTFVINNLTLIYIQINMILCLYKGFITIIMGDNGKYFNSCYSNFVGAALFY
jgi:hypothetical protein